MRGKSRVMLPKKFWEQAQSVRQHQLGSRKNISNNSISDSDKFIPINTQTLIRGGKGMGYVYESEFHVYNIIKKALEQKSGLSITTKEREEIERIIHEAWEMQTDHFKMGVLVRYNTHLPVNSLTWWAFDNVYSSVGNYIKLITKLINQFKVLYRAEKVGSVKKNNPEMDMIFRNNNFDMKSYISNHIERDVSEEFRNDMGVIQNESGVYFLYDRKGTLIYVGKSVNLGERIVSSIGERNACFYEYAITKSLSDTGVYEAYYISLLKPKLNVEGKYPDSLTINLSCIRDGKIRAIFKGGDKYEQIAN